MLQFKVLDNTLILVGHTKDRGTLSKLLQAKTSCSGQDTGKKVISLRRSTLNEPTKKIQNNNKRNHTIFFNEKEKQTSARVT